MTVSNVNVSAATISTYIYTATGSETSKSGPDDNGATLSYTPGKELVHVNGVLLVKTSDYTATDGSSITLVNALVAGDVLEVISFSPFSVANAVQASNFAAKGDLVAGTAAGTFTNVTVGSNNQVLTADSAQTSGVKWATISTKPYTTTAISSATTAVAYAHYMVNTASAVTLTLPASASIGDSIRVFDATGSANTNNITIAPNGLPIQGSVQNLIIDVAYGTVGLEYTGSSYGWKVLV